MKSGGGSVKSSAFARAAAFLVAAACAKNATGPDPPASPNNAPTAQSHGWFQVASGPHAVSCNACHGKSDTFQGFDCLSCHVHDQVPTDRIHASIRTGYSFNSQACYSCHKDADGGRQVFDHAGVVANCAECHDAGASFAALPVAGFTHPSRGGADCAACHVTGSWGSAGGPAGASADPSQAVMVTGGIPTYSGTAIVSVALRAETLPMQMVHSSTQVPAAIASSCSSCHAGAASGAYYPGTFHASLASLGLAQPAACFDCHAAASPVGFVGPLATSPARTPPSAEMKHDAVLWSAGKPLSTPIETQDCALCHLAPLVVGAGSWATGHSGKAPALYHSSLGTAPSSCVDCHANTRPSTVLTSSGAALPKGVQFDHGAAAALGDCVSCHSVSSSWTGGKFHLPGSATPSSCLPCHQGERPTSNAGWQNPTYASAPFDYGGNSRGVSHGDGLDCVTCHASPATWTQGSFNHLAAGSDAASTCVSCHSSQRPGSPVPYNATTFDHSTAGTGDCLGCHQNTMTTIRSFAQYPSDWSGGVGYPGSGLVSSPSQFITLSEISLSPAPPSLVTTTSSISATLHDAMLHVSTVLPAALNAGPTGNPDPGKCWHCHTNTNGTVTTYVNGLYHSSLDNFQTAPGAAITPLPQPTSQCSDCHGQMRPAGIVEESASDLQPMDHGAAFASGTVSSVSQIDCSTCHLQPGKTWTGGTFHTRVAPSVPQDCTVCHYPAMADSARADVTSGVSYTMNHRSAQLAFQNCRLCHASALSQATASTLTYALWSPGVFHSNVSPQPLACNDCHAPVSGPISSTQSAVSYRLAQGATSSNQRQWMSHASSFVVGKDCAVCHAADAKPQVTAWNSNDSFHAAVSAVTACSVCHGLQNGIGSTTPGTNNNLPSGLTDSTTLTTASSDPTTGVPAGTFDQINHADINVTARDCNACHTQVGPSSAPGVQGAEWAQASFHARFTSVSPLVMNGTTGRCSNCHMNVKPGPAFAGEDHSSFRSVSGTQDCASCHAWPGTGSTASPNWLGASAAPDIVMLAGWTSTPPTSLIATYNVTFAHPTPATYTSCAQCHAGGNNSVIVDYNHDGLTSNVTINGVAATPNLGNTQYDASTNPTFCVTCHNSSSPWISRTGLSTTISANTTSGSLVVTTTSTAALTQGMTISGTGIPSTTTTTTTFLANTAAGSTTVTTTTPVTFSQGTVISGPGIPANDQVAASINNATSFTLTIAATATSASVTLTAVQTLPLTVTITSITDGTSFALSTPADTTTTGTSLTVTHKRTAQFQVGNHANSTSTQECTSCHYVGGNEHLTPPTPGVFGSGSIGGN